MSDKWVDWQVSCWTSELILLLCRTGGLSDRWVVGQVGCRTSGWSDKWVIGQVGCWTSTCRVVYGVCRVICRMSSRICCMWSPSQLNFSEKMPVTLFWAKWGLAQSQETIRGTNCLKQICQKKYLCPALPFLWVKDPQMFVFLKFDENFNHWFLSLKWNSSFLFIILRNSHVREKSGSRKKAQNRAQEGPDTRKWRNFDRNFDHWHVLFCLKWKISLLYIILWKPRVQ